MMQMREFHYINLVLVICEDQRHSLMRREPCSGCFRGRHCWVTGSKKMLSRLNHNIFTDTQAGVNF